VEYKVQFHHLGAGFSHFTKQVFRHGARIQSGLDLNLQQLGLDYIDLSLMHFPIGTTRNVSEYDYVSTWKEMEKIVAPGNAAVKGKTRFIGISNFNVSQLEELLKSTSVKPEVTRHLPVSTSSFG
jgi:diketogulonate reductase-like aldo/keto reductase